MTPRALFALLLAFTLTVQAATAGIVMKGASRDPREPEAEPQPLELLIDGRLLKVDAPMAGSQQGTHEVLFRGDQDTMTHLNHASREYMVIDKQAAAQMGQQVSAAMAKMREQLAQVPEAQRSMVEKMMGRLGGSAAAEPEPQPAAPEVRNTGKTKTVDGMACTLYEIYRDGEKVQDLWATPWDAVGLKEADFEVLKDLEAFMKSILASFGGNPMLKGLSRSSGVDFAAFPGYPVATVTYYEGEAVRETLFEKPERTEIDASAFDVPADYRKMEMPRATTP